MFTYNIYLSTKRTNSRGLVPIYFRFKLPFKTIDKSSGIFIKPKQFNRTTKQILGSRMETIKLNDRLNGICFYLDELSKKKIPVDGYQAQIEIIFNPENSIDNSNGFEFLIDEYLKATAKRINNLQADSILPITLKKNEYYARCLKKYLVLKNQTLIKSDQVDKNFVTSFIQYGNSLNYKISHINKLVKFIKTLIRFGIDQGYCTNSSVLNIKLKYETKPIVYLKLNEVKSLQQHEFIEPKLERVKDLFLIQCYTGLSYIDLQTFTKELVYTDSFGNYFLKYNRGKNGKQATVPVQPEAMALFKKYKFELPKISNQKYNDYLKLVGYSIGLKFPLTSHIGRKTCGSVLLNNGVSIFTVKTILGHSSVKTTEQCYAELNESGIIKDLKQANSIYVANSKIYNQLEFL